MVSPEQQSISEMDMLVDEAFSRIAGDVGISDSELSMVKKGLNRDSFSRLVSMGWDDDDIKDLLVVVFNTSEENRVGVSGSMSRGKIGFVASSKRKLADGDSDIDVIIEANESFPEAVSLVKHEGLFSDRSIDVFIFKGNGAELILGAEYPSVIWVYENPEWADARIAAIYEFMYGY